MLQIRKKQMDILEDSILNNFIIQVMRYVNNQHISLIKHMSPAELELFIKEGINTAKDYGITAKIFVVEFIELQLTIGQNFHNTPKNQWAIKILSNNEMQEGTKILQLKTYVNEHIAESDIPITSKKKRGMDV